MTLADTSAEEALGVGFEGFLEGYTLNLRGALKYYFRLHEHSPNGSWFVTPDPDAPPAALSLMLDAFRAGHPVHLEIGPPAGTVEGKPWSFIYEMRVKHQV